MTEFRVEWRDAFIYCAHPVSTTVSERNLRISEGFHAIDKSLGEARAGAHGLPVVRCRLTTAYGLLDVEAGWVHPTRVPLAPPAICDATLPGTYAVGRLDGVYTGLEPKARALIAWAEERGLALDVERGPNGERWASRYDFHLAEPDFGPGGPFGPVDVCIRLRG